MTRRDLGTVSAKEIVLTTCLHILTQSIRQGSPYIDVFREIEEICGNVDEAVKSRFYMLSLCFIIQHVYATRSTDQ